MGKHHAPRPRGFDPGGFKFPGTGGWFCARPEFPGVLFANDLAGPRQAAPAAARVAPESRHNARRHHGVFQREARRQFQEVLMRSLVLFLLFLVSACAPQAVPGSHINGASVVALMHPTFGLDEDGIEPAPPRYTAFCNAFAVFSGSGVSLMTAEHCTRDASPFRYLQPSGVGHGFAELERRDAARDIAWLAPRDASQLAPLVVGAPPPLGSRVFSVSQVYRTTLRGTLTDHYSGGFYGTDQRVEHGWSGSPVFDESGRVWGVVVACPSRPASAFEGDFACVYGAIASALEVEP